jgi:hypothetical protein
MRRLTLVAPFGLLIGLLEGCGPGQGDVHGQVKYQGKVVSRGSVVMVGGDRLPIVGTIGSDGTYSLRGVPAGLVRIGVLSSNPAGPANSSGRSPQNWKGPADLKAKLRAQTAQNDESGAVANAARGKWFPLPKEYEDPDTSGLTTEVRRGDNVFDIELR